MITTTHLQYIDQAKPSNVLFGDSFKKSSTFGLNDAILVFRFLGQDPPFLAA